MPYVLMHTHTRQCHVGKFLSAQKVCAQHNPCVFDQYPTDLEPVCVCAHVHVCTCGNLGVAADYMSELRQVTEEAATKAKQGGQETYRTATEYASAAYDKVRQSC